MQNTLAQGSEERGPLLAGKLQEAKSKFEENKKANSSSDDDTSSASSSSGGGCGVCVAILFAPVWLPFYLSWNTDEDFYQYPYQDGKDGYYDFRPLPKNLFKSQEEEDKQEDAEKEPHQPIAKYTMTRVALSYGRESNHLKWQSVNASLETSYHVGLWGDGNWFKEEDGDETDQLELYEGGLSFEYINLSRFRIEVGIGSQALRNGINESTTAYMLQTTILPIKPIIFTYRTTFAFYAPVIVKTHKLSLGANMGLFEPFLSYEQTVIGGTKIQGKGVGLRVWF